MAASKKKTARGRKGALSAAVPSPAEDATVSDATMSEADQSESGGSDEECLDSGVAAQIKAVEEARYRVDEEKDKLLKSGDKTYKTIWTAFAKWSVKTHNVDPRKVSVYRNYY